MAIPKRSLSLAACALSVAALSAACSSGSGNNADNGATKDSSATIVKIGCTPSMGEVPQAYMMQNHLDTQNGFKLECVNVTTGPQQAALLVSGGENITSLLPANLYPLLDSGVPMVAFYPILRGPGFDLLVRKGFALPNASSGWQGVAKDLAKARIGVPAVGAAAEDLAKGMFQQAGVSTSAATYIATGAVSTTLAALSNGSVDAAITYEPGITEALTQGVATQPFSLVSGAGPATIQGWGGYFYVTTKSYAAAHAALLRSFVKAYQMALAWMRNPASNAQVVKFVQTYMGMPATVAKALVARNLSTFTTATTISAADYNPEGQFFYQLGATKHNWHVSQYAYDVSE
jgi:ABC-type nitrate/sulfonate/bicarbonate transport system substrate-binding protein